MLVPCSEPPFQQLVLGGIDGNGQVGVLPTRSTWDVGEEFPDQQFLKQLKLDAEGKSGCLGCPLLTQTSRRHKQHLPP